MGVGGGRRCYYDLTVSSFIWRPSGVGRGTQTIRIPNNTNAKGSPFRTRNLNLIEKIRKLYAFEEISVRFISVL